MAITRMAQKNLPTHPKHPVIPSPKKLPMDPNICTPQPRRPRITKTKIPMTIIAIIVSIAPMFNAYHLLSVIMFSGTKKVRTESFFI